MWGLVGSGNNLTCASLNFLTLQGKQTKSTEVPRLHLSSGFLWDVGLDSLTPALPLREESSDSEDEQPHQAKVLCFQDTATLAETPIPNSDALCGLGVSLGRVRGLSCGPMASTSAPSALEGAVTHFSSFRHRRRRARRRGSWRSRRQRRSCRALRRHSWTLGDSQSLRMTLTGWC